MSQQSAFERLFNPVTLPEFLNDFYCRLPLALAGSATHMTETVDWPLLERVLAAADADVLVVKDNRRWDGTAAPSPVQARELFAEGYTILVRHLERHDAAVQMLATEARRLFAGPVDVHAYFTPQHATGFGWHYDAEEVFILQASGTKEYALRKNTVNPWPLIESLPDDMQYERECMPIMQCRLSAGDWLYIPSGYWHRASAREDSISVSIGVVAPTALSIFDYLRTEIMSDLRWRVRLPATRRTLCRK